MQGPLQWTKVNLQMSCQGRYFLHRRGGGLGILKWWFYSWNICLETCWRYFFLTYRRKNIPRAVAIHHASSAIFFRSTTIPFEFERLQNYYWSLKGKLMSNLKTNAQHVASVWCVFWSAYSSIWQTYTGWAYGLDIVRYSSQSLSIPWCHQSCCEVNDIFGSQRMSRGGIAFFFLKPLNDVVTCIFYWYEYYPCFMYYISLCIALGVLSVDVKFTIMAFNE